jgi:hypothetical protein
VSNKADLVSHSEMVPADFLFNGLATDVKEDSMPLVDDAPVPKAHVPGNDTNQTILNAPDLDTASTLENASAAAQSACSSPMSDDPAVAIWVELLQVLLQMLTAM